jgi:hypothetical protein
MGRTVQNVKNSLKFKAQIKQGIISVRVGVKKYVLPMEARMLSGGEYLFLSFAACSELFKVGGKVLSPLPATDDAAEAFAALNPGKKRSRRKPAEVRLPSSIEAALKEIPDGYRLGYGPDGNPRLVRTRKRNSKG